MTLSASILSEDFGNVAEEVKAVGRAGVDVFGGGSAVFGKSDYESNIRGFKTHMTREKFPRGVV